MQEEIMGKLILNIQTICSFEKPHKCRIYRLFIIIVMLYGKYHPTEVQKDEAKAP